MAPCAGTQFASRAELAGHDLWPFQQTYTIRDVAWGPGLGCSITPRQSTGWANAQTASEEFLCTHLGSIPCLGGTCGYSNVPYQPAGELTREQIATLKEQLQQQIDALDEHAKTLEKRQK